MTDDRGLPIREELKGIAPYGAPQLDVRVRLNTNENPFPPSDEIRVAMSKAVAAASSTINRYPDREVRTLREKLSSYLGYGLQAENLWAANGSNEIWSQILGAFGGPGRRMLSFSPSYSMYPEYARGSHTEFVTANKTKDYRITAEVADTALNEGPYDVVAIASPDNPTGVTTDLSVITMILDRTPGIVVVDEAYQEFSSAPSALELLTHYPRLLVVRTMSKAFAFAGARVGYVAACPAVIDALRIVRLPYHLSSITQGIAEVALDNADTMMAQVEELRSLRESTMTQVRGLDLEAKDSQANFFLFGPFANPHDTWEALVDQGILVRDTGVGSYLRTSIGTAEEMDEFMAALSTIAAKERMSS